MNKQKYSWRKIQTKVQHFVNAIPILDAQTVKSTHWAFEFSKLILKYQKEELRWVRWPSNPATKTTSSRKQGSQWAQSLSHYFFMVHYAQMDLTKVWLIWLLKWISNTELEKIYKSRRKITEDKGINLCYTN